MARPDIHAHLALTSASLIFACALASSAAAMDNCGQRYRSCNVSCNQWFDGGNNLGQCKSRCDIQLIACGTAPPGSLNQARGVSTPRLPVNND
jgi:hypothetical protein